MKTNHILQGDCIEELKKLPEKSINMCMTSPPYWALRDYGTASWDGGDVNCSHLKNEGFLKWSEKSKLAGTQTQEVYETQRQTYKDVCGRCGAKRVDKQLGLEPTFDEYINKLCNVFDEVKRVLRDDGTCWVNIGDTYSSAPTGNKGHIKNELFAGSPKGENYRDNIAQATRNKPKTKIKNKSLLCIPFRFAIEMVNRGWILRNTIIWHKPNCMPSSVKDRFTVDFEYIFFFSKKKKYYFETQYEPLKEVSIKRAEYGLNQTNHKGKAVNVQNLDKMGDRFVNSKGRNKRTTWTIKPKPFKEAHFAVFPEELCETPIKAGCPEQGIVLDPFFGAGTTGLVALKQNKKFIGIELNPDYIKIAEARLKPFMEQEKLPELFMEDKK